MGQLPCLPEQLQGGDADLGKVYYATCAACHGPDGKGNELLGAPPIEHANDWYLLTQLEHFKSGVRGAEPRDTTGATITQPAVLAVSGAVGSLAPGLSFCDVSEECEIVSSTTSTPMRSAGGSSFCTFWRWRIDAPTTMRTARMIQLCVCP